MKQIILRDRIPIQVLLLFTFTLILVFSCTEQKTTPLEPLEELEPVHPNFTLSEQDLKDILEDIIQLDERALLPAIQQNILSRPQAFLDLVYLLVHFPQETFLLADKEHFLPEDYVPSDLVDLSRYEAIRTGHPFLTLNRAQMQLRAIIMPDLLAMVEAARQDGIILDLSSTYRSYRYQEGLFATWVQRLGQEEAERVSARPGASQHQLGTTIDFGSITSDFADHPAGLWLAQRASEFGFSLSYPSGMEWLTGYIYEPWHFRWIGRPAARLEQEYFQGSQYRMLLFWHLAYPRFASSLGR